MITHVILAAFAVAYLVWVFLFDLETGGVGPFRSKTKIFAEHRRVEDGSPDPDYQLFIYHITLWDRIRQWLTRAYRIEKTPYMAWEPEDEIEEVWIKNDNRMQVWECPKCLSFWMSIPLTLLYAASNGISTDLILIQLSTASVSLLIQTIYDFFSVEVETAPMVYITLGSPDQEDDVL